MAIQFQLRQHPGLASCELDIAKTVMEAKYKIHSNHQYSLVLVDIRLTSLNTSSTGLSVDDDGGFIIIEAIEEKMPDTPIIALTVRVDDVAKQRLQQYQGVRKHLSKPWQKAVLCEAVMECLTDPSNAKITR